MTSKSGGQSTRFKGIQYCASLKATDAFLENIYNNLPRTGRLKNTMVVRLGDHEEDPFKMR